MKTKNILLVAMLVIAASGSGCFWHHKTAKPAPASQAIVTPDAALPAKIVSINTVGRFVVVGFPSGQMPSLKQTLFVYRGGLKVAEVKITGPQSENNIVADLTAGEARVGDVVREQ